MKKCLIIGGGLAGLSSAVFLTNKGLDLELIEASPKLGGRTYSFFNKEKDIEIDNGQHILMGSYFNTFEFLKIIGSDKIPEYQSKLKVEYYKKDGVKYFLKSPHKFYPLNLIHALLNYKALTFQEKINALKFIIGLVFIKNDFNIDKNVEEYLVGNDQSQNAIKSIWELLTVSVLNTNINEASASMFLFILKKMFFEGNKASIIVLPKVPLSKLFIEPTEEYFRKNKIKFSCSEAAISFTTENNKIVKVNTTKREISDFDNLILSGSHHAIKKINSITPIISNEILNLETSSIITIHIWLKKKILVDKFVGLIDSKIHWVFDNDTHISIVISAADEFINLKNSEIFDLTVKELILYLPEFSKDNIVDYKVLKEKRATFKCTKNNEQLRSKIRSDFENMTFAGDWTNTKLPGTIEGAILSGKSASEEIFKK